MSAAITIEEWLSEVERLDQPKSADGWSVDELVAATKPRRSKKYVYDRLKAAIAVGMMELAGYRHNIRIDGRANNTPVYRRVTKKK